MLGYLARAFMLRRLFESSRRRRGYGGGYYPMARRGTSGGFFAPRRRHTQSNVRVFGCCLPGCGAMTLVPTLAAGMAGRYALRARRSK